MNRALRAIASNGLGLLLLVICVIAVPVVAVLLALVLLAGLVLIVAVMIEGQPATQQAGGIDNSDLNALLAAATARPKASPGTTAEGRVPQ